MVERLDLLKQWRAALVRLERMPSARPPSSQGGDLPARRQCGRRVLRYLLARYQDESCWGPFRGPSGGRMPRGVERPSMPTADEVAVAPLPQGGSAREGGQFRPRLQSIREINEASRDDVDQPVLQFRLITLLIVMTALSIMLAAMQHGPLVAAIVGPCVAAMSIFLARYYRRDEESG